MGTVSSGCLDDDLEVAKAQIGAMYLEDAQAWDQLQSPDKTISSPSTAKQSLSNQKQAATSAGTESPIGNQTTRILFNGEEDLDEEMPVHGDASSATSSQQSLGSEATNIEGPVSWMRDQFKEYATKMSEKAGPLTKADIASIQLLDIMRRKKAPLNTYEDLLIWHLVEKGELEEGETLANHEDYLTRNALMNKLKKRYNMEDKFPFTTKVKLPHSRQRVALTRHNFLLMVQSLLTDPELQDDDFDFPGCDPFVPPIENPVWLESLRDGEAFQAMHNKQCTTNTSPNPTKFCYLFPSTLMGCKQHSGMISKLRHFNSHLGSSSERHVTKLGHGGPLVC